MKKNILAENMKRFSTKNIAEQSFANENEVNQIIVDALLGKELNRWKVSINETQIRIKLRKIEDAIEEALESARESN